jgi:hypothetical protein
MQCLYIATFRIHKYNWKTANQFDYIVTGEGIRVYLINIL